MNIVPTGLVIIQIIAVGQASAQADTKSRTIDAFVLNKSSLVIPAMKLKHGNNMTLINYPNLAKPYEA